MIVLSFRLPVFAQPLVTCVVFQQIIVLSFRLPVVAQPLVTCVVFQQIIVLTFHLPVVAQPLVTCVVSCRSLSLVFVCQLLLNLQSPVQCLAYHRSQFSFASCYSTFIHLCSVLQIIGLSFRLSVVAQPLVTCVVFQQIIVLTFHLPVVAQPLVTCVVSCRSLSLVFVCQLLLNLQSLVQCLAYHCSQFSFASCYSTFIHLCSVLQMIVLSFRLSVVAQPLVTCVVFYRSLSFVFICQLLLNLQSPVQCFTDDCPQFSFVSCCSTFSHLCSVLQMIVLSFRLPVVAQPLVTCVVFYRSLSLVFVGQLLLNLQSPVQCFTDHCPYFSFASCCSTFSHLCSVLQMIVLSFHLPVVAQPLVTCVLFYRSLSFVFICQLLLNLQSPVQCFTDDCPQFSFASRCSTFSHLCSVLQIIVLCFRLPVVAQPFVTCVVFYR